MPVPIVDKLKERKLFVTVRNRHRIVFESEADALSSKNDVGVFDILPSHANFISLVKDRITIHKGDKDEIVEAQTGILRAIKNKVDVYLEDWEEGKQS
jgi:F0F1-type ATP synthase epsilon subunit